MTINISDFLRVDPNLIPDQKDRLKKEAWELFRRACNMHDAAHSIDLTIRIIRDTNIKKAYNIAHVNLIQHRDFLIEAAIDSYTKYKEL